MWTKFPKHKPKKDGWYLCTVEVPHQQRYTMMLYWYGKREGGKFIDNNRQYIFDAYNVYTFMGEKMTTCSLCDRTDEVVAFRKTPKSYMKGFYKK